MSISADGAAASHIIDAGRSAAAIKPPSRPKCRRKQPYTRKTTSVAAAADGSRAVHSVTPPKGRLARAMAA